MIPDSTTSDLVMTAMAMRDAQKRFYKTRHSNDLREAKAAEQAFDRALREWLRAHPYDDPRQLKLFNADPAGFAGGIGGS